jgi:hypothetical protein
MSVLMTEKKHTHTTPIVSERYAYKQVKDMDSSQTGGWPKL